MAPNKIVNYRHVYEGQGGIFSSAASTSAIGTRNCITGVGVYFPILKHQVFVAHINAYIFPRDWEEYHDRNPSHYPPYICERNEGAALEAAVNARLRGAATLGGWRPTDVDISKLVLVCSGYNNALPIVGKFIVQAIRTYFNMKSEPLVHDHCHGFVVNARNGETILIPKEGFEAWPNEIRGSGELDRSWTQLISEQMHEFRARDLKDADGLELWDFALQDNAVPMAERQNYDPRSWPGGHKVAETCPM